jgi:D-xylose transport system ATP-binding protein
VRRLGEQGLAVVLISHNLHDIFEVADSITVLRLGQNVQEFRRRETNQQEVVQAITAGTLSKVPASPRRPGMSTAMAPPPTPRPRAEQRGSATTRASGSRACARASWARCPSSSA